MKYEDAPPDTDPSRAPTASDVSFSQSEHIGYMMSRDAPAIPLRRARKQEPSGHGQPPLWGKSGQGHVQAAMIVSPHPVYPA